MRPPFVPDQFRQHPFTTQAAREAGLTRGMLQSAPWQHVFLNVWAHRDLAWTRELRLAAARLVLAPDAVCCGLTAAWLLGLDVRRGTDDGVHVSFPRGRRPRARPGVGVRQETLDESDTCEIDGVRLTTPLRTAFDCLRWLPPTEGLVVADAMTHAGLTSVDALAAYFAGKHRLRNLRRGEALLVDVEPKTESPMETRTRIRLVRRGCPRPEAQVVVRDGFGRFVARLDLGYREELTAVEYDGSHHWEQRRADDRRRDAVRGLGWEVIVVNADDVYSRGNELETAVWRSLRRHGPLRRTG